MYQLIAFGIAAFGVLFGVAGISLLINPIRVFDTPDAYNKAMLRMLESIGQLLAAFFLSGVAAAIAIVFR